MKKDFLLPLFLSALLFASCDNLLENAPVPPWSPQYADNVVVVDSDLSSVTVWEESRVYYISGLIRMTNGGTLTIQPGTTVKFTHNGYLLAEAGSRIYANGTSEKPIIFTSANDSAAGGDSVLNDGNQAPLAGDWYNVELESGCIGNEFQYCRFSYGGREKTAVLKIDEAEASVENCTFRDNLGGHPYDGTALASASLDASTAADNTVIASNTFYRNYWPLAINCRMCLNESNTFSFDEDGDAATEDEVNTHQGIYVNNGNIDDNVSWDEAEVPLCFFGNLLRLTANTTLSVASGTVIKSSNTEFQIEYGAHLNRDGVIFTSFRDDLTGDTNGDGNASEAVNGDWVGIGILDNDGNIEYVTRDNDGAVRYSEEG